MWNAHWNSRLKHALDVFKIVHLELVIQVAPGSDGERDDELFEVYWFVAVRVERP